MVEVWICFSPEKGTLDIREFTEVGSVQSWLFKSEKLCALNC